MGPTWAVSGGGLHGRAEAGQNDVEKRGAIGRRAETHRVLDAADQVRKLIKCEILPDRTDGLGPVEQC